MVKETLNGNNSAYLSRYPTGSKEYKHQWYLKNRERTLAQEKENNKKPEVKAKLKEYNSQYYKRNRNKILQHVKEYANNNKEKKSSYIKDYYRKNKDDLLARNKVYWENNKHKFIKQKKEQYKQPEIKEKVRLDMADYYVENKNKIIKRVRLWCENNPTKKKAHGHAQHYKQRGDECVECRLLRQLRDIYGIYIIPFLGDENNLDFHHTDYIKNEGVTLCRMHHWELHKQIEVEA